MTHRSVHDELADATTKVPVPNPPLASIVEAGRRRRRRHQAMVGGTWLAVAGAVVAAVLLFPTGGLLAGQRPVPPATHSTSAPTPAPRYHWASATVPDVCTGKAGDTVTLRNFRARAHTTFPVFVQVDRDSITTGALADSAHAGRPPVVASAASITCAGGTDFPGNVVVALSTSHQTRLTGNNQGRDGYVHTISFDRAHRLVVSWLGFAANDPMCCPSRLVTTTYGLQNGKLVESGWSSRPLAASRTFTPGQADRTDVPVIKRVRVTVDSKSLTVSADLSWRSPPRGSIGIIAYLSTARSGPRYALEVPDLDSAATELRSVRHWTPRSVLGCRVPDSPASSRHPQGVTMTVPARCLSGTKQVRVAVETTQQNPNGTTHAWAPGYHRLFPWVRLGG